MKDYKKYIFFFELHSLCPFEPDYLQEVFKEQANKAVSDILYSQSSIKI